MQVVKAKVSKVVQICRDPRAFARDADHLHTDSTEIFSKFMSAGLKPTLPKLRVFFTAPFCAGGM